MAAQRESGRDALERDVRADRLDAPPASASLRCWKIPLRCWRVLCACLVLLAVGACEPYRIEYHQRPEFYYQASEEELKDEWIAPDGTIVRFSSDPLPSEQEALAAKAEGAKREVDLDGDGKPDRVEPTPTWDEKSDGSVTMRAFLPEHVIGNLMQSLREERYGEFYDQMLASATRDAFNAQSNGQGKRAFTTWCAKQRRPMMEMLNRMGFGYLSPDVVLRKTGPNSFRIGFTPRLAEQFKFTTLDVAYEDGGCRLVRVQ